MSYSTGDSAVLYLNVTASLFVALVHVVQIVYSIFYKFTKCDLRCKSCCGLFAGSASMTEETKVTEEQLMTDVINDGIADST
jgi:hypothetical protein